MRQPLKGKAANSLFKYPDRDESAMKKIICILVAIYLCSAMQAQHKITFVVNEKTYLRHDSIFLTGTFNGWDSTANPVYLLKPLDDDKKVITLDFKSDSISYKFHRGSWQKVEKSNVGTEVVDRKLIIKKDSTIYIEIPAWRDNFFVEKWYGLTKANDDSERLKIITSLAVVYSYPEVYNQDSALFYAGQSLKILEKLKAAGIYKKPSDDEYTTSLIMAQETTASVLFTLNNFHKSLQIRLENLRLGKDIKDKFLLVQLMNSTAWNYSVLKDYPNMLKYARQMDSLIAISDKSHDNYNYWLFTTKKQLGWACYETGNYSQALDYARQVLATNPGIRGLKEIDGNLLLGNVYLARQLLDSAFATYHAAVRGSDSLWGVETIEKYVAWSGLAKIYQIKGPIDSALFYASRSYQYFTTHETDTKAWGANSLYFQAGLTPILADLYQQNKQQDSAYKYLKLSIALKDSLYNTDKIREAQMLTFNDASRRQQEEQQALEAKKAFQTTLKFYVLFGFIAAFFAIAFLQYRSNRQKQKTNQLLRLQNQKIETTLNELKNTQKQLIQSEKMASLGELTAGIAHEIQNPLNFVNNFSEVSNELIDEMKVELDTGNRELVIEIANDIKQNLDKINHHGKRAEAIVKGMLQHSRTSSGQKELTDINALCDEYLRLTYHGLRAKDKSFNATLQTDFDNSIGKVNIIASDIGRAVLNLVNNALYAVNAKKKSGIDGYEPTVTVSTKTAGSMIEILVADNGNGIPKNIIDKIFQPFFTTKPTGQGTGLGLSLAYDIIKAHEGELKVESKEGEGTIFTILLPA